MIVKRIVAIVTLSLAILSFCASAFAWSPRLDGRPESFGPGAARGYYIWRDGNELHVWTTTRGQEHQFSGVLRTNGRFIDLDGQRLENRDFYSVSFDRDVINFRFNTAGNADGLSFKLAGGSYVDFDLFIDGHRISPEEIHIGRNDWHPARNDFKLLR